MPSLGASQRRGNKSSMTVPAVHRRTLTMLLEDQKALEQRQITLLVEQKALDP
jgi:hypothetical protein